jgi:hypothetical protein
VVSIQSTPQTLTNADAGNTMYLQVPETSPNLLGSRYTGEVIPGVTVLGSDYLSSFEFPPSPGYFWNGVSWVTT